MGSATPMRLVIIALLVFTCSYVGTSFLWFPSTYATLVDLVLLALPPNLEHNTSDAALAPGVQLDASMVISEAHGFRTVGNRRFVLTAFDTSCSHAAASVPFWNKLTGSLEAASIDHVVLACGPARRDLEDFIATSQWSMPVIYAGPCEEVADRLGMSLGIVQYVLDDDWRVVAAWAGRPVAWHVERDNIAQILHVAGSSKKSDEPR